MTHTLHRSLLLLMILAIGLVARAFDFGEDGIYYNIVSSEERTVEVTNNGNNSYFNFNWIDIPATVEHAGHTFKVVGIGARAFSDCRHLDGITLAEGIKYIGEKSFRRFGGISSFTLPASVDSIGPYAFAEYKDLKSMTIKGTVSIAEYAFSSCSSMQTLSFKGNVTRIADYAFDHCEALTSLTIPSGVESIGDFAFLGCYALASFKVSSSNEHYCSVGGVIFDKDKTVLVAYPNGKAGEYVIPNSVKAIADCAFAGCKLLTALTIPEGVDYIGLSSFNRCQSLSSLTNLSKVPQTLHEGTFATYGVLHVLPGYKDVYKTDKYWGLFRIVDDAKMEETSDAISIMQKEQSTSQRFDLQGRPLKPSSRKQVYVRGGKKFVTSIP